MKQMIYGNKKSEILDYGTYKGIDYVIVNLGGYHPCAYVRTDSNYYANEEDDSPAHYGFTFYGSLSHWAKYDPQNYNDNFFNRSFIGWDFGHYDDYLPFFTWGKKWTTKEVLKNVKEVINWIIIKEDKNEIL